MTEEFNAYLENDMWERVQQILFMNVVGYKWIYKAKYASNGSIECYKACLVALGNHQQIDIHYHETFSPVVKASIVRLILNVAISCDLNLTT